MDAVAVALALGSASAWGVGNFLAGGQVRKGMSVVWLLTVSQIVGLITILGIVAVRGGALPSHQVIAYTAVSSLAGLGGLMAFYRGLEIGAMGVVAPLTSLAAVVSLVWGLLHGEQPSPIQLGGAFVAFGGVAFVSYQRVSPSLREPNAGKAIGLALLAALGLGSFFVGLGEASNTDPLWGVLISRVSNVTLLVGLCCVLGPQMTSRRPDLRTLACIGVLDVGGSILFALASTVGLLSLVSVIASLATVVVAGLAWRVLKEHVAPSRRFGAALALIGAALITAG